MSDRCRFVHLISACILTVGLLSSGLAIAASIPVWLDDAITSWNQENSEVPIRFLDIKDSFVWYMMPKTDSISNSQIRERMYAIAESNKYQKTVEEELITTGKPPSPVKPYQAKKCWSRIWPWYERVGSARQPRTHVNSTGNTLNERRVSGPLFLASRFLDPETIASYFVCLRNFRHL